MNKWGIFAGLVVAVVVLNQINTNVLTLNDVINVMDVKKDDSYFSSFLVNDRIADKALSEKFELRENTEDIRGAIVPPNVKDAKVMANFFKNLAKNQEIDTFVIISSSDKLGDKEKIAVSLSGVKTSFGNVELDEDFVSKLIKDDKLGATENFNAFNSEQLILLPSIFIKRTFPEAKIVPILLKSDLDDETINKLAEKIYELSDGKTLVLASTDFSQRMDKNVAAFHDEMSKNLLESFDIEGLKKAEIRSKSVIGVLMSYLKMADSMKANIEWQNFDVNSEMLVSFSEGEPIAERNLHIMAFGDVMLGRYVRTLIDNFGSKDYVFKNIRGFEGRFFKGADVVFANLEGPIKGQGKKGGTAMSFSFNEDVAQFLKDNGFNLLSIANNHAVDQGWAGRDSTIEALNMAGLPWCGHPSEADKNSVYYNELDGKKFAFVCFHDVTFKLNDPAAIELIKEVNKNVDYVFVSIHWGIEYKNRADWSSQIEPGRAFVDAGADFVIGHHPHVIQNFEIYKGKAIFYSLGNFVFDQYWAEMTQEELALGIVLGEDAMKVYLFPMKSEKSQSRLMNEQERAEWLDRYLLYGDYDEALSEQIKAGLVEVQ